MHKQARKAQNGDEDSNEQEQATSQVKTISSHLIFQHHHRRHRLAVVALLLSVTMDVDEASTMDADDRHISLRDLLSHKYWVLQQRRKTTIRVGTSKTTF